MSNVLVSLILNKSVSTGAEICCRFCQAFPSDPYRLGCGTVPLTVSYQRTNNVESTLIQRHDIETISGQHCCVPSGKLIQNIGVGRVRKLGRVGERAKFRILGEPMGPNSQQAHDVITTSC